MADPTEPKEKPLRSPTHRALAAKFPGVSIADPKGFTRAMQRAQSNFAFLKEHNTATLDQTLDELSLLVGALEKLETALKKQTAAQRRAIRFVEAAAGKKGLRDRLADFLDFVPEGKQIFRDALEADAGEIDFDITHGRSKTPPRSLVAILEKIHGQYVGSQISKNEFVRWALNEQLNIRDNNAAKFSKDGVRQLRRRAAIKNPA